MKWPFTKTEKDPLKETTRLLATPPRPRPTSKLGVPDDLRKTQAITIKDTIPSVDLETETPIPVRFESISAQVSPKLFLHDHEQELANLILQLPASLLVPQLASGRIKVDWADLVPLIPAELLKRPAPPGVDQPAVILPMGEIVAAIPAEAFTVRGTEPVDLNSEDFEDLPQLFDDAFFPERAESRTEPSTAAPTSPPPAPKPPPVTPVVKPVQKPWASAESIYVKLRSLVAGMPDSVFACPRADLWQCVDPNTEIALPSAPLIPQLGAAKLTLPLETVINAMPPELFVAPLPAIAGQVVPLPLHEVVRQLPPSLFSIQSKAPVEPTIDTTDTALAEPFHEKSSASEPRAEPAVSEPGPALDETAAVEEPPPSPEVTEPQPAELDSSALTDDEFAIFSEKPASTEPALPVAPVTTEPEPVGESPSPEPVLPVADAGLTEPAPPPAPVAETNLPPAAEPGPASTSEFLININRCSFEDLLRIDGVGPALARRIVEYRSAHGLFQSIYELRNVPGVGRKTFRALAGVPLRRLNRLLGVEHDQELALGEIARRISAIPGVDGCVLTTGDGLPLTGQLPPQFDQERFSVFAPQLFKRIGRCTRELSVGDVNRLTLFTNEQPVSIFKAGAIFLVVIHHPDRFSKALLRRCANISEELARLCRQRAAI